MKTEIKDELVFKNINGVLNCLKENYPDNKDKILDFAQMNNVLIIAYFPTCGEAINFFYDYKDEPWLYNQYVYYANGSEDGTFEEVLEKYAEERKIQIATVYFVGYNGEEDNFVANYSDIPEYVHNLPKE